MSRSTNQRDGSSFYRVREHGDGRELLPSASGLFVALAARVWDDVTGGTGVVGTSRVLTAQEEKAAEVLYMRGASSSERARLARHARLKKEAAEAKKKGGKR